MASNSVHTISIDLPTDILLALNETEKEITQRVKVTLAVQLYGLQKLTIGKAAQLAGLPRLQFEKLLSNNAVAISHLSVDEVMADVKKLK
jgi:predicted HTH domain antitoxin